MKSKKNFTVNTAFLLLTMCCSFLYSQDDILFEHRNNAGIITFANFTLDEYSDRKMDDGVAFLKKMLQAKEGTDFHLTRKTIDELGITTNRYQQYYKGVKVDNAEYLLHGRNGYIETMSGDFQNIDIPTIKPNFNEQQALLCALKQIGAKKYKGENAKNEKFIRQHLSDDNATFYPKGELVIVKDYLNSKEKDVFKLSGKFSIFSSEPNDAQMVIVDAINGEIIQSNSIIMHANTPGTAHTLYSGIQNITCDSYHSGEYRLYEKRNTTPGNTVIIETMSDAHSTHPTNRNTNGTSSSGSSTINSWSNFALLQHALDIHWASEQIIDYFSSVHSRNGIGNGITDVPFRGYVRSYASYKHGGPGAHGEGAPLHMAIFGNGYGTITTPGTSLDIAAHEFGHGITVFSSNLAYTPYNQESAALNEGFSDIGGVCLKNYVNKKLGLNKFLGRQGEEIYLSNPASYNCNRDLQNPKSSFVNNYPTGKYPNTYKKTNWNGGNEDHTPHSNSTILSHWFYILSMGKSEINDNGHNYNVAGIGINRAEKIAYRTLMNLYTTADYYAARNVSIQAARDLYGFCSPEAIAVTNAWYAVGVGNAFVYPSNTINIVSGNFNSGTTTVKENVNIINVTGSTTVKSGATLILDACDKVTIEPSSSFKVEAGASFIIK